METSLWEFQLKKLRQLQFSLYLPQKSAYFSIVLCFTSLIVALTEKDRFINVSSVVHKLVNFVFYRLFSFCRLENHKTKESLSVVIRGVCEYAFITFD